MESGVLEPARNGGTTPPTKLGYYRPTFVRLHDARGTGVARERQWDDLVESWSALTSHDRTALCGYLLDKFSTLGPIWMRIGETWINNEAGRDLLAACAVNEITEWSADALAFASTMWVMESSDCLLTELNDQELGLVLLESFLSRRLQDYEVHLQLVASQRSGQSLGAYTSEILRLRPAIDERYFRCYRIDGKKWRRQEKLIPRVSISDCDINVPVREEIRNRTGLIFDDSRGAGRGVERLVDDALHAGIDPFEMVVAIAHAVLRDPVVRADYCVITMPRGEKLETPWELELGDIACYVAVRETFEPTDFSVKLSREKIRIAIAQRMRFNTVKRALNYHPQREKRITAQPFQFPDISRNEDSHYTGHIHAGIRTAARTHFLIDATHQGQAVVWRGLGDLRVNRANNDNPYTFEELESLLPYGVIVKAIFQVSMLRSVVFDAKYSRKK